MFRLLLRQLFSVGYKLSYHLELVTLATAGAAD
jgi:hypothetical protein